MIFFSVALYSLLMIYLYFFFLEAIGFQLPNIVILLLLYFEVTCTVNDE